MSKLYERNQIMCSLYAHRFACCVLIISSALVAEAGEEPGPEINAGQIIDRMTKVYAECRSYRDSGVVKTVFVHDDGTSSISELPFNTAFLRPDRFRFEYFEQQSAKRVIQCVVWRHGKKVQTWHAGMGGVVGERSLALAVAGATGVSGGSAHTIPCLLIPDEIGGRRLNEMKDLIRLDDGKLESIECYRIQGTFTATGIEASRSPTTLWIDSSSYLIRRVDDASEFSDFRTKTTTTYQPSVDTEIGEELLAFTPPVEPWFLRLIPLALICVLALLASLAVAWVGVSFGKWIERRTRRGNPDNRRQV